MDFNVSLTGAFDAVSFKGTWRYSTIRGLVSEGAFEAIKPGATAIPPPPPVFPELLPPGCVILPSGLSSMKGTCAMRSFVLAAIVILVLPCPALRRGAREGAIPRYARGRLVAAYIEAFNSDDRRRHARLSRGEPLARRARAAPGRAAHDSACSRSRADVGTLEPVKIVEAREDALTIIARGSKGAWLEISFAFEKDAPAQDDRRAVHDDGRAPRPERAHDAPDRGGAPRGDRQSRRRARREGRVLGRRARRQGRDAALQEGLRSREQGIRRFEPDRTPGSISARSTRSSRASRSSSSRGRGRSASTTRSGNSFPTIRTRTPRRRSRSASSST